MHKKKRRNNWQYKNNNTDAWNQPMFFIERCHPPDTYDATGVDLMLSTSANCSSLDTMYQTVVDFFETGNLSYCATCSTCDIGWGVEEICDNDSQSDTVCQQCPDEYYSGDTHCELCDTCQIGVGAVVACSSISNSVCVDCVDGETFSNDKSKYNMWYRKSVSWKKRRVVPKISTRPSTQGN